MVLNNESGDTSSDMDDGTEELCKWCDCGLGYAKLIYKTVCVDCYDRLKGANIPDAEIFAVP